MFMTDYRITHSTHHCALYACASKCLDKFWLHSQTLT